MTDDGLEPAEVTGRWVGFYRYRSEQLGVFPIVAQINQSGDRITGEMYDQITDISDSLERILEAHQEDMTQGRRRKLERVIKQFGTDSVVVASRLPDTSDLEGRITGSLVEFTKTYRGSNDVTWIVKGKEIAGLQRRRHRVYYSGHLDRESKCISGEWSIRLRGLLGRFLPPLSRGGFELYWKS
jgi:hypothetical protein